MNPSDFHNADKSLDEVVVAYLEAVEGGQTPDRQEWLARYPHLAPQLSEFFADQDRFGCLARPLREAIAPIPESAVEERPSEGGQLGDFRLLREIGRGGMGIVYEAEQISLGRRVALKVLPFASTLDTKQLQRFKNEAQAAAQLHHSNIVPVHATGCERGVHYFAMQFIEGQTLAALIRELRQLTAVEKQGSRIDDRRFDTQGSLLDSLQTGAYTPEDKSPERTKETASTIQDQTSGGETPRSHARSSIFDSRSSQFFRTVADLGIQAAEALEHAHQLGVVHRDIKPANLLVDGRANLWITDFGLAHCQSQAGITMTGDLVGTLRYMSPEQALAQRGLVDHRTDIYSLGATLYELLTLEPPFPGSDRQELLRQIAFEEPRPLRRINPSIPPELEIIVRKSMEKSPSERYATAQELADDLRRFLRHEPILAKKPTWGQRVGKWSRRHPAVMRSAVLMLALITAGSLLSIWLIWQEKKRTGFERDRAEREKETALAVRDFLQHKLLLQADPLEQAKGLLAAGRTPAETKWNPSIGELLDRAARELTPDNLEAQFPNHPVVQADILQTIGNAYYGIGAYGPSITHLERARDLLQREFGLDHLYTLRCLNNLAIAYWAANKLPEAIRLFEQVHERQVQNLSADHRDTLSTLGNLAVLYKDSSRTAEAIRLLEQVRDTQVEKLGPDDPDTLNTINNLAVAYQAAGRLSDAIRIYEQLRDQRIQKQGPDYPETLITLGNLACAYRDAEKLPQAIQLFEQVRDRQAQKLGPDHPDVLITKDNLAKAYQAAGRLTEAIPLFEEVLSKRLPSLGPDHPHTRLTRDRLGRAYVDAGRIPEAIRLFDQMREKLIEKLGADHSQTLLAQNNLAFLYWTAKQLDRSVPLFEQVLEKMRTKLGEDHPETLNAMSNLAINYLDAGRLAEAEPLCREFLNRTRRRFGPDQPQTAGALALLGSALMRQNKSTEAEKVLRECLAIRQQKEPNAWMTFSTQSMLGETLLAQKKCADAEPLLLQGYEGMKQREASIPPQGKVRLTEALERLVRLCEANGQKNRADIWRQKLADQKNKESGDKSQQAKEKPKAP